MSDWRETNKGNYIYELDSGDVMTVFQRQDKWFGVHDNCFSEEGFADPGKAMTLMELAVLSGQRDLLVRRKSMLPWWQETKSGGYQCVRRDCTLTVKRAKSGSWYLIVDQTVLKGRWFDSAEEAKRQGDLL